MATTEVPDKLKPIGVASYYVLAYGSPPALNDACTVRGELLVTRSDRGIAKNYQYNFATASDGTMHFAGPYKSFYGHHVQSGQGIPVNSLFGHTPFSLHQD
jgi:hypothetical protein